MVEEQGALCGEGAGENEGGRGRDTTSPQLAIYNYTQMEF